MSLRTFFKFTAVGRWLLIPVRWGLAIGFAARQAWAITVWAFRSKEYYNHTYHLTDSNLLYLASFTAVISGHDAAEMERYIHELQDDEALRTRLIAATQNSQDRHNCDLEPRYGRRLGWYALVRATKPRVVMETGVDRGLGTAVIAAALKRNMDEGYPGVVYATDIMPDCGHLLVEPYRNCCRILLGDSVTSLKGFAQPVDLFLHDSDHRPEYEWAEFLAIEPRLHRDSIVLSDNSQQSTKLRDFAARSHRSFLYFQDAPSDHWWPGDGIGAAFEPGIKRVFQPAAPPPDATKP